MEDPTFEHSFLLCLTLFLRHLEVTLCQDDLAYLLLVTLHLFETLKQICFFGHFPFADINEHRVRLQNFVNVFLDALPEKKWSRTTVTCLNLTSMKPLCSCSRQARTSCHISSS